MIVMGGAPDGWYSSVVTVENADKGRIKAELIAENCGDGSKVLMLLDVYKRQVVYCCSHSAPSDLH